MMERETTLTCVETGTYGDNDAINIPAGTVLLTGDLPQITESVTVEGVGIGESVVDGDGQYVTFSATNEDGNFTFRGFTITGYADSSAIYTDSGNVTLDQIEVDGTGTSFAGNASGLTLANVNGSKDNTISLNNVYVHSLNHDITVINTIGIGTSGSVATTLSINNVTISDIQNTQVGGAVNGFLIGVGLFGGNPGTKGVSGTANNVTVTNLQSDTLNGFVVIAATGGVDNTSSLVTLRNATLTRLTSNTQGNALGVGGAGFFADDTGAGNMIVQNVVLADNYQTIGCGILDISAIFGGTGTGTGTFTSQGGNLSDDNTCEDYFTEDSDQNNVGNLASTLGPLSDNGGFVPTIPLLKGSPAIDSGVTVPGLTTDARLAVRPQGSAYDSGAYESPYTKPKANASDSLADTGENVTAIILVSLIATTLGSAVLLHKFKT